MAETYRLLSLTTESVLNQRTSTPFRLLIVSNAPLERERFLAEVPEEKANLVESLVVRFPPPSTGRGAEQPIEALWDDKGYKLVAALHHMRPAAPSWVYPIDSDDWIASTLVEAVTSSTKHADLWYVDRGLLVDMHRRTYVRKFGMCRYCGTSFIHRFEVLSSKIFTSPLNDAAAGNYPYSKDQLREHCDQDLVRKLLGNHRHQLGHYKSQGHQVARVPGDAICWVTNTGENHSGSHGQDMGTALSAEVLSRYGISSIEPAQAGTGILNQLRGYTASVSSRLGWLKTDKNAERV
jgi:hypothetical protein